MNINNILPATAEHTSNSGTKSISGTKPISTGDSESIENTFSKKMDEVSAQNKSVERNKNNVQSKLEALPAETENLVDVLDQEAPLPQPTDEIPEPIAELIPQNFTFAERNADDLTEGQMQLLSLTSENTAMPGKGNTDSDTSLIRGSINMLRGKTANQPPLAGMSDAKIEQPGLAANKLADDVNQQQIKATDKRIDIAQTDLSASEKSLHDVALTEKSSTANQPLSQLGKLFSSNTADAQQTNSNTTTALEAQPSPMANTSLNSNAATTQVTDKGNLALQSPVASATWTKELGQQLVGFVNNRNQSVTLHLNPVELGPLQIELKVSDQQAQVQFTSANILVRSTLENAIPELRDTLAEQGINLGETMVGDQPGNHQEQVKNGHADRADDAIDDSLFVANELQGDQQLDELNGRINLYV